MEQDKLNEFAIKAGFALYDDELHVVFKDYECNVHAMLIEFAELILASQAQPTPSQSDDEHVAVIHGDYMDTYYRGNKSYPSGTKLYTKPQPTSQDAERWRYFIETCSGEAAFELTGITDASNAQINTAIDAKMKESKP